MKFTIKDFSSKCDHIHSFRKLQINSELALQRYWFFKEKIFWKYAANLEENTYAEVWLKKIEVILRHGFSPVNLLHIFRTTFYKNNSGGLLPLLWRIIIMKDGTMIHWDKPQQTSSKDSFKKAKGKVSFSRFFWLRSHSFYLSTFSYR